MLGISLNMQLQTEPYMHSYLQTISYMTPSSIEKVSLWIKIKQRDLETCINHALACVGDRLLNISIKNYNTYTEQVKLSTRLWYYMANSSFLDVIH